MEAIEEPAGILARKLEGELRLIEGAILMVARKGAPRVLVAGLQLGGQVLEPAQRLAAAAGVRLVPLWTSDETLFDIRVEALR
ncbi:MAG: hypothetical protein ACYC65_14345 [Candidatus Limnocylindrales bacterium]